MKISRRHLLKSTALVASAYGVSKLPISFLSQTEASAEDLLAQSDFAIIQGLTNATSAQLILHYDKKKAPSYKITNSSGEDVPFNILRTEKRSFSNFMIEKILVPDLSLGLTYKLSVINDAGNVLDERLFSALDVYKNQCRFVVGSCMKDALAKSNEGIWKAIDQNQPDFIIFNGDTCYSDKSNSDKDEKGYWRRYSETRQAIPFFKYKKLIPILAVWDDHDYGSNNGNINWQKKNLVKDIFEIFWDSQPTHPLEYKKGPGVSSSFTAFGQRFFLMDGRYFKSESKSNGLLWGEDQENLLFQELNRNNTPAWILNGTLFFGGYLHWECFEAEHAKNFKNFLAKLSQIEAPVAFISGDVHFAEIMEIEEKILGYKTYEFVASSIHSSTFPLMERRYKNPRRVDALNAFNFTLFESQFDLKTGQWQIHSKYIDSKNAVRMNLEKTITR